MQAETGRVLLIDDDINIHPIIEKVVVELGLELVAVRSGEDGLAKIEAERPRAVILDGLLPGVRGEDVARKLRTKYSSNELPIVFVTAFYRDLRSYRLLTDDCGVDALLHKPLVPDHLRAVLVQVLDLERRVPEGEEDGGFDLDVETDFLQPETEAEAELLADYLASLKDKLKGLRASIRSLDGPNASEALRSMRMDAHRLRGSGTSYGYPEVSRLGGAIEDLIERGGDELLVAGPLRARLGGLVEALATKIDAALGAAPIPVTRSRGWRPKILLLDGESPLAEAVMASPPDGAIRLVGDIEEAMTAAIDDRPDVVVIGQVEDGNAACSRMQAAGIGPVVLTARGDSLAERLMAIDAGAVGYVARPSDIEGLFRVATLFARPRSGTRVVAAGGDRAILNQVAQTLAPHGIAVDPAPEPGEFVTTVERLAPALIVLDVDSWKMVGPKLLQVQGADLSLRTIPIVALSSSTGSDRVALLDAGAVAVLGKPVDPEELAAIIVSHLAKRQSSDASRGRDPLTGLYDRAYLRQVCERSVSLARREGRTLAVVGFEANLDELRKREGSLAVDEILAAYAARLRVAFRDSDVVARIGPSRFATLLHSVHRLDVERLLNRQLEDFRELDLGLASYVPEPLAALALFPETMEGADALLESVDRQLNEAQAASQEEAQRDVG